MLTELLINKVVHTTLLSLRQTALSNFQTICIAVILTASLIPTAFLNQFPSPATFILRTGTVYAYLCRHIL